VREWRICDHPECTRPEHLRREERFYVGITAREAADILASLARKGLTVKVPQGPGRANLWALADDPEAVACAQEEARRAKRRSLLRKRFEAAI
jgi:hypothetical protein